MFGREQHGSAGFISWSSCRPGTTRSGLLPSRHNPTESIDCLRVPPTESEATLMALAQAVEQRDPCTAGHCERLAYIAVTLGVAMGLKSESLFALHRGGFLHDIGKVGLADSILFKKGKLSDGDWIAMRSHPVRGEEICRPLASLRPVLPLIRHHHENWDGSGYPDGLQGEQIPLTARILQVADIYDALVSPRPYKPPYSAAKALQIIQDETSRGLRDPQVVAVFLEVHGRLFAEMPGVSDLRREPVSASLDSLRLAVERGATGILTPGSV